VELGAGGGSRNRRVVSSRLRVVANPSLTDKLSVSFPETDCRASSLFKRLRAEMPLSVHGPSPGSA
jgi:hypothetical protein